MKPRLLSTSLAFIMILTLLPITALAGDYENHWAAPYIEQARERGWLTEALPDPDKTVNRAEFANMLWLALGSPEPQGANPFTDIADNAVTALHEVGIVKGYGGGLFGPDDHLTREMAFVMLARAFELKPANAGEAAEYTAFDDYTDVSTWATDATSILIVKGYAEGDGKNLMPKKQLTLGELVKLLIMVADGENVPGKQIEKPIDDTVPVITLTQSPTASTYNNVKISVSVESKNTISYIGWRSSSSGAKYSDKTGFTDITTAKTFSVSSNGWYAVCAVDSAGNFAYKLAQITNIQTSSGGGGGGGGSSTTYYTVTFNANGGAPIPANQSVASGNKATNPGDPSLVGNTFGGWYKESTLTNLWDFANDTVTASITLYAKWTPIVPISYTVTVAEMTATASYGSLAATPTASGQSVTQTQLNNLVTPNVNYSVEGYYTSDNPAGTKVTFPITSNTTVYVRFTGDGTNTPITIATRTELAAIASSPGSDYILVADINLAGSSWTPMCSNADAFTGTFDGNGNIISNMTVASAIAGTETQALSTFAGLFGYIGSGGSVKNLGLDNVNISLNANNVRAGGAAGLLDSGASVTGCFVSGTVAVTSAGSNAFAGSVVGMSHGSVSDCYATCAVSASGGMMNNNAGGIAGDNYGTVLRCYATGSVASGSVSSSSGGIAGRGSITQNSVALNVSVTGVNAGRISGDGGTLTGNHAIAIGTMTGAGAAHGKDGALITPTSDIFTQAFWSTTMGWNFGSNDASPWKMGSAGYPLPTLYWQTAAPALPAHLDPAKIAANAEAAKIVATGISAGTNNTNNLVFDLTGYASLVSGATLNLSDVKTGAASPGATTNLGAVLSNGTLSLNTQKTVDAADLTYVGITFTVTLNGVESDERTLDISTLLGATTTAGQLRTDKAALAGGKNMENITNTFTGDKNLSPSITLSTGVSIDEVNNSGGDYGSNNASVRAVAGGPIIINVLNAQTNDGLFVWFSLFLTCDGTNYSLNALNVSYIVT